MRRALRNLRNIHGSWVRRGRRCVRRYPARLFACRNHGGRLSADSISSGEAMGGLCSDTIIPMVLSRLFFYLIPARKLSLQRLPVQRTP